MSANMEMFPDDWMDFVESNSVKETKFGTEYVPKLKVVQAMSHYIKNQNSESAIHEAIAENPYMILGVCLDVMMQQLRTDLVNDVMGVVDERMAFINNSMQNMQKEIHDSRSLDVIYSGASGRGLMGQVWS